MTEIFYPNDCNVCKKRTSLKRCSRCQMISYCGELHQKESWPDHRDICHVISGLMKEKKVSHLYEDLRGCSPSTWTDSRQAMTNTVTSLLGRKLEDHEMHLLQYPRSCFVCHDTRQNNLTDCPRCPLVSFCKDHPNSPLHDEICSDIVACYVFQLDQLRFRGSEIRTAAAIFHSPPFQFETLPNCTKEYLDMALKSQRHMNERLKWYASTFIYMPLTLFGAVRKLKFTSSTLTIYFHGRDDANMGSIFWEIFLHLMADLKNLTIVANTTGKVSSEMLPLCRKCIAHNRKLTVKLHNFQSMGRFDYESVDLAVYSNLNPPDTSDWRFRAFVDMQSVWNQFSCPVLLTTSTSLGAERIRNLVTSCPDKTILYDGRNDFSSMSYFKCWEDWRIGQHSRFMLIAEGKKATNAIEGPDDFPKQVVEDTGTRSSSAEQISRSFYAGMCHVCKKQSSSMACPRCKMIFYCGKSHMKMNQSEHREICKVILGFLNEAGTAHLYDKVEIQGEESWLRMKIALMKKAKLKLNRDLLKSEKQMFLFPKTCFVCHESDLSVLKTCECNISLCKIHRENDEHKKLCDDFRLMANMERIKGKPEEHLTVSAALSVKDKILPPTLNEFIDTYFLLETPLLQIVENSQKIIISEFLTRPLTFVYAVERMKIPIPETMAVHIIGAINEEFDHVSYWNTVVHWFSNLKHLLICFIGIELSKCDKVYSRSPFNFLDQSVLNEKFVRFHASTGRYEDFLKSKSYIKPDVIIGYNLNIHESNLGIVDCTWKKTFSTISKLKVPFVLTAMSRERAEKDHEMLCSLLGKTCDYEFSENNPYCSLMPERDFETEGLCYSNKHVIAYKKLIRSKSARKTDSELGLEVKIEEIVEDKLWKFGRNSVSGVPIPLEDFQSVMDIDDDELLRRNMQLQEENEILMENLRLKEENERLMSEHQKF